MGNVQMEADQIRYRGQFRNVQEALDNGGGGGGGTTVVANPSGAATADLSKLQVGEGIYGIPATAAKIAYSNTGSGLTADDVQAAIDEMVSNFGDGVDDVYNACVAAGSTPTTKSPADIATAIGNIGGGGADIVLNNQLIADVGGSYISAPLSETLAANTWLLVAIKDGTNNHNHVIKYTGGTNSFSLEGGTLILEITATTAGLSDYSGDWRKIYAIISIIDSTQVY